MYVHVCKRKGGSIITQELQKEKGGPSLHKHCAAHHCTHGGKGGGSFPNLCCGATVVLVRDNEFHNARRALQHRERFRGADSHEGLAVDRQDLVLHPDLTALRRCALGVNLLDVPAGPEWRTRPADNGAWMGQQ